MHATSILSVVLVILSSAAGAAMGCNIFILAGQSNMVGRGGTYTPSQTWDGVVPPECESDPRILRLNDDSVWEEAREPLHQNISFSACLINSRPFGIGPGMPFSTSLLKRDPAINGTIGLVPCAVGGTSISQWSKGSCLYTRLLTRARAALKDGGVLRAMLWYQGESDTTDLDDAGMYKSRLEQFFSDVRSDLLSPSLPIIQVAVASGENEGKEIVRQAQLHTSLPNVKCVDAAGLPLNGDNLHLTTDSQVRLGSMLADAFLRYFDSSIDIDLQS